MFFIFLNPFEMYHYINKFQQRFSQKKLKLDSKTSLTLLPVSMVGLKLLMA